MNIQPIPTFYDGIWFRSRLEARWAVFYNALLIPYEYEPEGYHLGLEVGSYLIDFWLPVQRVWIEVKPDRPTEIERRKAHALAVSSGSPVYVFMGGEFKPTYLHPSLGIAGTMAERFPGVELIPIEGLSGAEWMDCPTCGPTIKAPSVSAAASECERCGSRLLRVDSPRLVAAYEAARAERFERGYEA